MGSQAHYEDPAYYDHAYRGQIDDVVYYTNLAAAHPRVLEYGIGNGRIALPIARMGTNVAGIDLSKAMLADLRTRLGRESSEVRTRVTARRGDMRFMRLGQRFPLVLCTFNTALHLYTRKDVERWLARVREHLLPGGELVVDIGMPVLEDLVRNPMTPFRVPSFVHPTAGRVKYHEYFDYDRVRQITFVSMCFEPVDRKKKSNHDKAFMTPLAHRQFFPQEWEALLHYNGFEVHHVFGDFHGGPLTATSDVMIWHARSRRGWRMR
ncbi:MAG: class I SAM-dependent methyltransferase [Polyangiaceae bacterium]|nr:class I SAM-dependent methyltransferase [Polyangiaceae bacterium]